MNHRYTYQLFPAASRITAQATDAESQEVIGSAFIYGNTVKSIWVDPDHRRRGVATGMWNHIVESHPELHLTLEASDELEPGASAWVESLKLQR